MKFFSLLDYHRAMLADPQRVRAWRQAISQIVRRGDVVVDIGAGTGILSFLACTCGAERVYAIEESPILIVARELAVRAPWGSRIIFVEKRSTEAVLPERSDVVLADVLGSFGLNGNILATMADAHDRFLMPGGTLMPADLDLFCAPLEMPDFYDEHIDGWHSNLAGFDHQSCRSRAINSMYACELPASSALGEETCLGRVPVGRVAASCWNGAAELEIMRSGRLHGIGGWCTAYLTPGIRVSNSPFAAERVTWPQTFFPISEPVPVAPGDLVRCDFRLGAHGPWMVWNWQVVVQAADGGRREFRHSTFRGDLLPANALRERFSGRHPRRSAKGDVIRAVLELCDGTRGAEEVEDEVIRRFPESFPSRSQASEYVRQVVHALCD